MSYTKTHSYSSSHNNPNNNNDNDNNNHKMKEKSGRKGASRSNPVNLNSSAFLMIVLTLLSIQLGVGGEANPAEKNAADWQKEAEEMIVKVSNVKKNENVAKNIILFMGDAMSLSTIAAGRILKGQLQGKAYDPLAFEGFPHVALSKTYSSDRQVSDSASTGTAYLCGSKTNFGVLGFDSKTKLSVCESSEQQAKSKVDSILRKAHNAGKLTGVVTTTRITHASPAASYVHVADRNWESDNDMKNVTGNCKDIARQLVDDNSHIRVLLGGGRRSFLPKSLKDPETGKEDFKKGRLDGRNLIKDWQKDKESKKMKHSYVWTKKQFEEVNPLETDYLLGLFSPSHMAYEIERDQGPQGEPSLVEMTEKAIQVLKKGPNGFFLFVEGGLIDAAHHDNLAKKSLYETLTFDRAIQKAIDLVDTRETLVVVTTDHSTAFNLVGYPTTHNPIFGAVDKTEWGGTSDGLGYTTLIYATGPGFNVSANGKRADISKVDTADKDYLQQTAIPMDYETHTGEDVAIYATGPWSHLYQGVREESYIPHVMAYAACISPLGRASPHCTGAVNSGTTVGGTFMTLAFLLAVLGTLLYRFD